MATLVRALPPSASLPCSPHATSRFSISSLTSSTPSPPSDSSSSDSEDSDSVASTPSSTSTSELKSLSAFGVGFSTPVKCVYIPSPTVEPGVLSSLFDKHAEGSSMCLCMANPHPSPPSGEEAFLFVAAAMEMLETTPGRWTKETMSPGGTDFTCFVSTLKDADELGLSKSITPATPQYLAQHLQILSLDSLRSVLSLPSPSGHYTLHIVERPAFVLPPLSHTPSFSPSPATSCSSPPTPIGKGNIPTPAEWRTLWSAWDLVTLRMIPQEMLHQKPIDLRHKCLFYIGHIPTFLDMLLSKAIGGAPTEPKHFWQIFERGIDPHVDDPDHCHNHSEVPEADEDWPTLESIMSFRDGVRARLMRLYDELQSGKRVLTRNIARTLVMTLEHEGFHVETLLYMLLQRAGTGTLPPPGFTVPPWALFARQWDATPLPPTCTVTFGPSTVVLGHQDSEADDFSKEMETEIEGHEFGWDNESPERRVEVGAFKAEWRPVSNGEFERFWRGAGKDIVMMPKSWVEEDGEVKVRTMYGPVPMEVARHWPVLTSYDDLAAYAHSKGGRLPTEAELRLFLDTYDVGHEGGANIGFRTWHPVPATTGLEENGGKGSNGGVWEWTSTLFDGHDGLVPTNLFTGYSVDFFDTKHQVVLGASYATIPRLAGRRTIRNFYQHNYPYPWVGARIVYDL